MDEKIKKSAEEKSSEEEGRGFFIESISDAFESIFALRWAIGILILVVTIMYSYQNFEDGVKPNSRAPLTGFHDMKTIGNTHFLVVEADFINDREKQALASAKICENAGQTDYCEVYIYNDAKDIPTELPIIRGADKVIGMYKRVGNDVKFRLLHDGGMNPTKGRRVAPKINKEAKEG